MASKKNTSFRSAVILQCLEYGVPFQPYSKARAGIKTITENEPTQETQRLSHAKGGR